MFIMITTENFSIQGWRFRGGLDLPKIMIPGKYSRKLKHRIISMIKRALINQMTLWC